MNGKLPPGIIVSLLNAKAAELVELVNSQPNSELSVNEVRDMMSALTAKMADIAFMNIDEVALNVVREMGTSQKIQIIKEVRSRTGSGLKEAKDAIERALPKVLKEEAEKALRALEFHNDRVSYGYRAYVHSDNFRSIF